MGRGLSRRQAFKALTATVAGTGLLFIGDVEQKSTIHTPSHSIKKDFSSIYAPGEPAKAPTVKLQGHVASYGPGALTIQIGEDKVLVNIQHTQMWRLNTGRAWEAKVGEEVSINGDYTKDGVLQARHVWLGLSHWIL